MSQAEDLLNSLSATVDDHKHDVPDSDTHFKIDPYTRQIENTNYRKTVLMRGDHKSERFTFEVPRYVDGHDMSLCNRVYVHFDNVGISIENAHHDVAEMKDLRINPDDPETVISSWLIRREATQFVGILSFSVQYQCVEGEEITYEWNTDSYDDIEIRQSKNNTEAAVINYTNVLEQWRSQIFGAGDTVMANIAAEGTNQVTAVQAESATQQAAIELKGSETLDTIPEDYTEVRNMAREAVRTKTDSVVCESEGDVIRLTDSSDDFIRGLNVYGKTTQVTTTGAQLAYIPDVDTYENNGITWSSNGGVVTAKGNAPIHSYTPSNIHADLKGLVGTFYLSGNGKYIKVAVQYTRDDVTTYVNAPQEFTLDGTETRVELYCQITTYNVDINDTAYPMVNAGNVALPYEPYTGGIASPNPDYPQELVSIENPIVTVCGKNLFNPSKLLAASGWTESNGIYSGNSAALNTLYNQNNGTPIFTEFKENTQYTLTFYSRVEADTDKTGVVFSFVYSDGTTSFIYPSSVTGKNERLTSSIGKTIKALHASYGHSLTVHLSNVQLEEGYDPTEYEPYKGDSIELNYTLPSVLDLRYPSDNILIRDEIDLERGVRIQRLGYEIIDGNEAVGVGTHSNGQKYGVVKRTSIANSGIMSDRYIGYRWCEYDKHAYTLSDNLVINDSRFTDVTTAKAILAEEKPRFVYPLATPVETPLTAEEIETYKTLKTNRPNTTVLNNAGAWMKVKYNADTQIFLENLPKASDEQVNASVTAWLEAHYSEAEGASF